MNKESVHGMTTEKASLVKRRGHQKEEKFNSLFGSGDHEVNWSGSSADNYISMSNPIHLEIAEKLGIESREDHSVSLKSSNTIQIHLGNIPELTDRNKLSVSSVKIPTRPYKVTKVDHGISFSDQTEVLKEKDFWRRYLKKGDILCYDEGDAYFFFAMEDIIDFIVKKCNWRMLVVTCRYL